MGQDLNERVELTTERLLLRPFAFDDVDDVLNYASDPEVARYVPLPQPYTRDDAVEFVARQVLADWSSRPLFAIVFEHHVIGSIALRIDEPNELADLGYALARPHWGQGLMPEAVRAVITWGFRAVRPAQGLRLRRHEEPPLLARHGEAWHDPRRRAAGPPQVSGRAHRRRPLRHPPRRVVHPIPILTTPHLTLTLPNVRAIMSPWVHQQHHPLLRARQRPKSAFQSRSNRDQTAPNDVVW